jgi:glutathione S-transferase
MHTMTQLTLHGFSSSNYYNKAKLALLLAGADFAQTVVYPSDASRDGSPLKKVPYLHTAQGTVCESQVIVDYVAQCFPQAGLYPADPFAAAKVRELCTFLDVHMELVARRLHPEALWGGKLSDSLKEATKKDLIKGIRGFASLATFAPFVAGSSITAADCAAWAHLPLIRMVCKRIYNEDLLEAAGIDVRTYLAQFTAHPAFMRVAADAKADGPAFAEYVKKASAAGAAALAAKNTPAAGVTV